MTAKPKVFFGYGSTPELARETLSTASTLITNTGLVESHTWEELSIGGRIVIDQVLASVDGADLAVFDISTLNENVLFELGYAIARGKPVWLLLEKDNRAAKKRWNQFRLLSSVGYEQWANSDDIRAAFLQKLPYNSDETLYDDIIEPNLTPQVDGSLFYLRAFHETEASKRIERRLDAESRRGVRLIIADPTESSLSPLAWYAQKVYETNGTIAHFVAHRRDRAWVHNARMALVAGMAIGFERPALLLAEEDYSSPFDYQDRLRQYASAADSQQYVSEWLTKTALKPQRNLGGRKLRLITELRGLRFGEPVAENEADVLSDYFVETASFDEVISSRNTLFIGRKGAGKTANMLQAAATLRGDARNLVIVIKPQSYELEGLVALLNSLPRDVKSYTVFSLWSFLLQSEIANAAVQTVGLRPTYLPMTQEERELITFVDTTDFGLRDDFAVRFERTVAAIEATGFVDKEGVAERRDLLNEALHSEAIRKLRKLIGPVLKGRNRVAILIDNLDKAWDREADLDAVSQLLLGLLAAIGQVSTEYQKEDFWRDRISLTLATFLRSDIYAHLQDRAREPDKIPNAVLSWDDPQQLHRVIEERFLAARPEGTDSDELWTRFLCSVVSGRPTKEYLTWRTLPRPRDIVYLCNAAVIAAVDRRHESVLEEDFLLAEKNYSQFALEALLVENGITVSELEDVLFEFAGGLATMTRSEALNIIQTVIKEPEKSERVLSRLLEVSFLGQEVSEGRFVYPDIEHDRKRVEVLARKLAERTESEPRVEVHPAYRPYLEILDS